MVIQTDRLQLREMIDQDFDHLYEVFSDKETMSFYPSPFDEEKVSGWIDWNKRNYVDHGYGLWALIEKESGKLIGDCGLINQTVDGSQEIEVGYHVNRAFWGNGYATEAAIACRDYAFSNLKIDRVISLVRPENLASCCVAEKSGMAVEREIVKFGYKHYVYASYRKSA